MTANGAFVWTKILLRKKCIVWTNLANGFAIAYLKDLKTEISLPDDLPNFNENFDNFKRLWNKLDFDLEPLFKNILSHQNNQEYCCLDCEFPFMPFCSQLYSKFDPGGPEM